MDPLHGPRISVPGLDTHALRLFFLCCRKDRSSTAVVGVSMLKQKEDTSKHTEADIPTLEVLRDYLMSFRSPEKDDPLIQCKQ